MSQNKLQQLVGSVAKAIENNQKFATASLANRLAKYTDLYPQDKTLGSLSRVMTEMSDKQTFIRKADFQKLYNQFYSYGTQAAELFEEELVGSAEPQITTYQRDEITNDSQYQVGDQVLANALESVFDNHIPLKMYSKSVANKALKSVGSTLEAWNLRPTQLTVGDGNDKFIVIKADYESPKGITSFYVPVEVNKEQVVDPEVFMGNSGPEDLNYVAIKAYLKEQAGGKTKIGATDILSVLTDAASTKREVSGAELALTRLNANRQGKSEFFADQIVGLKVEAAPSQDVKLPASKDSFSFEKEFSTAKGLATWKFGEKVELGRQHIARQLHSFGFKNTQIVVSNHDEQTIFYGVSLDTGKVAFTVPVKITQGQLNQPAFLLCNGSLASFSREGINQLVSENKNDIKVAAVASTMASLKPSEVINNLRQALSEGNHAKAEDALNVLANCGDAKAYQTGFEVYMSGLAGNKIAETQCSQMIKSAVSEYLICSHTGLPINKVYQDKHGYCRPLYRQGMDETYEGATFINAKIFG